MSVETSHHHDTANLCATCGEPLTQRGPHGECLRCLARFGMSSGEAAPAHWHPGTPGALRYAHFEIEIGADGFPIELGAGAIAVTYRARDTVLNSVVALKVIDRIIAENSSARARFLREARAAAQIHHPNVARVTHYGEQDGECFYALELVHGETLEARVRREGPLPLTFALEVVQQATRALAAADQTQSRFVGTPAFASPEQFAASEQTSVGTRSDIYSLGVTFWYLLAGRTPFIGQTLEEIRARESGPLPIEQLKSAHVPPQVLALDPADRPQSARELLAAVNRSLVRFEPAARRRRKRSNIGVAAVAIAAVLAALALISQQRARSTSEIDRSIAILPFENLGPAGEDEFLSICIQEEILTKLATLADVKVIARSSSEKYKSKPPDVRAVGQELGVGRVLAGSVQRAANQLRVHVQLIDTRTNAQLWANTYDRHLDDAFAVESEVANAIAQQLNAKLAGQLDAERPSQSSAAYHAYLRGLGLEHGPSVDAGYQRAAAAYAEAVQLDPNFARAWARLSLVRTFLYLNGIDREANSAVAVRKASDRAIALAPESGEAWLAVARYRQSVISDQAAAVDAYRQAEKYLPNSPLVQEHLGYVDLRFGDWRSAEAHLLRAAELDPRSVRRWHALAMHVYGPLGRFADAQAALERALQISPNSSDMIAGKADLFQQEGRLEEAAQQLARIPEDSSDLYVLNVRGFQAMCERDFPRAIYSTEQATKGLGPDQPLSFPNVFTLVTRAYCPEWAGRPDEARATFERLIRDLSTTPGLIAPGRGMRSFLALAYAGVGEREKTLEQARQGVADHNKSAHMQPGAEVWLAKIQARFGEADAAIAALPRLQALPRGASIGDLRLSPFWDPLRQDRRFQALIDNAPPVQY